MVDLVTFKRVDAKGSPVLIPATPFDVQRLEKIGRNDPLKTVVSFSRSIQHHRWYRGLVAVVAEGLGIPADVLHSDLKWKAGLVRRIIMAEAGPVIELDSTAFNAMDESRFREFAALAENIIFRDYLPGIRRKDVLRRVEEIVGPRPE